MAAAIAAQSGSEQTRPAPDSARSRRRLPVGIDRLAAPAAVRGRESEDDSLVFMASCVLTVDGNRQHAVNAPDLDSWTFASNSRLEASKRGRGAVVAKP